MSAIAIHVQHIFDPQNVRFISWNLKSNSSNCTLSDLTKAFDNIKESVKIATERKSTLNKIFAGNIELGR
jgi:hypothetical protein